MLHSFLAPTILILIGQIQQIEWSPAQLAIDIIPGTTRSLNVEARSSVPLAIELVPDVTLATLFPNESHVVSISTTSITTLTFAVPGNQTETVVSGNLLALRLFLRGDANESEEGEQHRGYQATCYHPRRAFYFHLSATLCQ